ncbi:MAG: hypothetical protein HKN42_12370 [Granulosicoccus sp.]|nr:hypothetical protein [Granulosicoccus sp.]
MTTSASAETLDDLEQPVTWVQTLSEVIGKTDSAAESRMHTVLSCDIKAHKPALFLPPDMAELQPRSLRYLHAFAKANDLRLIEDRRRVEIQPVIEQRDRKPPMIALGLSTLLQQTGLPGAPRPLSTPHRLNADSPHIGIARLIKMAAFSAPESKRVVVLPNQMMINVLNDDTQPITGYACRLITADTTSILSHFDSPNFRAIGYSAGHQYVMHVCLAGGPLQSSTLWSHLHTLTRTDFRFQLFPGRQAIDDFGLFYATFYLNLSETPSPWWLEDSAQAEPGSAPGEDPLAEPQPRTEPLVIPAHQRKAG